MTQQHAEPAWTLTDNSVSIFIDGDQFSVGTGHRMFPHIKQAIIEKNWDGLPYLIDCAKGVRDFIDTSNTGIVFEDGVITYNGTVLGGFAVEYILRLKEEGFDVQPFLNYLGKLQKNPDERNRRDQFEWLVKGQMPITPEGNILAFKYVDPNYLDCYSQTFDNSVGRVVEMPRGGVDPDPSNECSRGLHFCSRNYLSPNQNNGNHLMLLEIDPADVVAFPRDYNVSKGRCWRYKVIGEIQWEKLPESLTHAVHDADDPEAPSIAITDKGEAALAEPVRKKVAKKRKKKAAKKIKKKTAKAIKANKKAVKKLRKAALRAKQSRRRR
jgi:hypothetical protein